MNSGDSFPLSPHTLKFSQNSVNQLIEEYNSYAERIWQWTYDDAGNITSKKRYNYTTGTLGSVVRTDSYSNTDASWGDLLTSYNGRNFTYDANGNLTNDRTWIYTWQQGRQLATMSNGSTTWTYTYAANGMRIGRSNGTKTYSYLYTNGLLSRMILDDDTLCFAYDAVGAPLTVNYNGTTFYYVTIVHIIIEHLDTPIAVYNFEVEDFHTYYVGDNEILVHNICAEEFVKSPRNFKDVANFLKQNGFEQVRQNGSHVIFKDIATGQTIPVPNHGKKAIAIETLRSILKKVGLL